MFQSRRDRGIRTSLPRFDGAMPFGEVRPSRISVTLTSSPTAEPMVRRLSSQDGNGSELLVPLRDWRLALAQWPGIHVARLGTTASLRAGLGVRILLPPALSHVRTIPSF